jgi:hypothetical protein
VDDNSDQPVAKPKRSHKKKVQVTGPVPGITTEDGHAIITEDGTGNLLLEQPVLDGYLVGPTNAELFANSQPYNRQWLTAKIRAIIKQDHSAGRKAQLAECKPTPKIHPERLPTYLIHKIYKMRGVSIKHQQHKIGLVGISRKYDPKTDTKFVPSLFTMILKRRGKKRAIRKAMENHSRVMNRAA